MQGGGGWLPRVALCFQGINQACCPVQSTSVARRPHPAVYLCKYFTAAEGYCYMVGCYTSNGGFTSSDLRSPAYAELNAFDYWSSWTTEMKVRACRGQLAPLCLDWLPAVVERAPCRLLGSCCWLLHTLRLQPLLQALYIFGCAIGVLFWLIALPCAIGSVAVAKRRTVS